MAKGQWVVTSGTIAVPVTPGKTAIELATGATIVNDWIGFDVTFDGVTSTAVPARIGIKSFTASGTGTAITYSAAHRMNKGTVLDPITTAKVNITTEGTGPVVIAEWFCHPQAGQLYQFPLGREYGMGISQFKGINIFAPAAVNCVVNLYYEE